MAITANQALYNASLRHQVWLLRFAEGQAEAAGKALKAAEGDILEKISGQMAKGLDVGRLEALLTSVKKRRAEVYDQLGKDTTEALQGLSEAEANWETTALQGASPVMLNLAAVPLETLHATVAAPIAGIPLDGWLNNIKEKEALALQAAVTQAVLQGETIDDLVRRIRGSKAKDYADGILSISTRNAQALARTAVNHVSNAAREQVWEANSDIVRALRWTSTLDGRTSTICQSRDGHLVPVGKSELLPSDQALVPAGAKPPAHFQCRSLFIAIMDGVEMAGDRPFVADERVRKDREKAFRAEAKERGVPIQQVRKEWAQKYVGTVPSATTYQDWLKGQPKSFQDDVLGAGKAELFRSGVPLERFVDTSGKVLSLQQLKAEIAGDSLNVLQPAIGLKAKGLLMQGLQPDEVLTSIKNEFPEASTSAASIASYKSELKKAGLLDVNGPVTSNQKYQNLNTAAQVNIFEGSLPTGLMNTMKGQWATVVDELDGHPGAYAHYKPGVGVELSDKKMQGLSKAQARQIMAHELGHMLNKVHGFGVFDLMDPDMTDPFASVEDWGQSLALKAVAMPSELKKLYGYYIHSQDELIGEIIGQAIHPSPVTSQGMAAGKFVEHFAKQIANAKQSVLKKFPDAPPVPETGPVMSGIGEVPGKPTSIGGYAKALLQQGMGDQQVLNAVMAEFPNAKTGMNSIKSYKSELKKAELKAIGAPGPTVVAKVTPQVNPGAPLDPPAPPGVADPAAKLPKPSTDAIPLGGLTKIGGKPGGSNPGAVYKDAKGDEYLVKGNIQKVNGNSAADESDARAKNEVLATRLLRIVDPAITPEMKLVDLEGQFGGGLGVASRMLDKPIVKFDPDNATHVAIAQKDFAIHAWLGNYDVVGADFDNLVMKGGKAVNIDPGGALMFRAMGKPKDDFDENAETWNTMRKGTKNPNAKKVYGSMTDDQLVESAKRLMIFTDEVIEAQVKAMNPGLPKTDDQLIYLLKARRDDILLRVGLKMPAKPVVLPTFDAPDLMGQKIAPDLNINGHTGKTAQWLKDEVEKFIENPGELPDPSMVNSNSFLAQVLSEKALELELEDGVSLYAVTVDDVMAAKLTLKAEAEAFVPAPTPSMLDTLTQGQKDAVNAYVKIDMLSSAKQTAANYGIDLTDADIAKLKAGNASPAVVAPVTSTNYKAMTAEQLVQALVPSNLEIKSWFGSTKASYTIQQAAIPLFKSGVSTQTVQDALIAKFGTTYVPKVTSLASMKSKLKKAGYLDGTVVPAGEALKVPTLWGKALGSKSSGVKEQAKLMIASKPADEVTAWIATQFSSYNPQGAQDLFDLAFYEVKSGKTFAKPGVAAVNKGWGSSANLETPVPLRPATKPSEASPPPPRFTDEHRKSALQKYGSLGSASSNLVTKINKTQKAAGLESLTQEELDAIKHYTNSGYSSVNRQLREGEFANNLFLQAWTDAASHGLKKMPNWAGTVTRGMSVDSSTLSQLKQFYKPGAVVEENAFLSTSDKEKGSGFGGNIRYDIKVKTGTDVRSISSHGGEQEILLAPGMKFKVLSVEPYSGGYGGSGIKITMEEV